MDAAVRPCKEVSNLLPFMIRRVVPDHVDEALVRVGRLNFGQELDSAEPVYRNRLDKCKREFHCTYEGFRGVKAPICSVGVDFFEVEGQQIADVGIFVALR